VSAMDADEWCDHGPLADTLIIAPPGCGKTELLARRAGVCIRGGHLPDGRRILALTFTNKARDNLGSRLADHAGPSFRRWITVVNFHGLALHLYNRHRYVLGDSVRELLPDDRALRSIERRVFDEFNVPRAVQQEFRAVIRDAKAGPFTDDEVIDRLNDVGSEPALEYERLLRAESRMDHEDVLRFGLQVIQTDGVAQLYAERFAYVLVDEAQDLTRVQYDLVEPIGRGCTVFAGDKAQGIYGFAGADPDWVFDRIGDRSPIRVHLDKSYRSSPEVLAVVNAVAGALGGPALTAADPAAWAGRGRASLAVFESPDAEAEWLLSQVSHWQSDAAAEDPPRPITVGVLTRMKVGGRRDALLERARASGLQFETWDHPLHRPEVVQLLRRHLDGVLATVAEPRQQIEELYLRCFADVPAENANTLIDLRDAADELVDLIPEEDLETLVDRIRISSEADMPVGPGLHILTGHTGKGQGFDKVVILGFEEGQIPSFFVKGRPDSDPDVREELALLHVMTSRAKEELVFTICRRTNGYLQRPSRWLPLVEPHLDRVV
jgi:DNA helicase-2/ATP-dependent DNA helicase PcrA